MSFVTVLLLLSIAWGNLYLTSRRHLARELQYSGKQAEMRGLATWAFTIIVIVFYFLN